MFYKIFPYQKRYVWFERSPPIKTQLGHYHTQKRILAHTIKNRQFESVIRSDDTGQRIPCFDSCQLITTLMCNMCTISVFLCSQTTARKCEIEHWLPCGAKGRAGGVRSRDYQIFWDR